MNDGRGGLLTAGGVLAIIAGVMELIGGGVVVALGLMGHRFLMEFSPPPGTPGGGIVAMWLVIAGAMLVVLGIIAIAGGISALRRKSFGLALAGAICALPASVIGLLSLIFVALGKGEFEAAH